MKIQLVTPAPLNLNNGNKITALRWARMYRKLGHHVRVTQSYHDQLCDLLVALHARRSADSIRRFRKRHPDLPLIVVLTGTDVYRDIKRDSKAKQSLEFASKLVVLQKMALHEIPRRLRAKTHVIYQSAEPIRLRRSRRNRKFNISVIAHLRSEKDPLRTAIAVRHLPPDSRIHVTHIGQALDPEFEKKAKKESTLNPRYRWIGPLSHRKARERLAHSALLCISSTMEGSSNVLSEALASGVPVVASRISGLMGTLGSRFPGYFPVGNTKRLAALLLKAESQPEFYRVLKLYCARLAPRVDPKRELRAWRQILEQLARTKKARRIIRAAPPESIA